MIAIVLDTETGGLVVGKNGVHQVAGMVLQDGKEIERFEYKIKFFTGQVFDEFALRISNTTVAMMEDYADPIVAMCELADMLEKYEKINEGPMEFVAHNAGFDWKFMVQLFTDAGQDKLFSRYFKFPVTCTMKLARAKWTTIKKGGTIENHKLPTVTAACGIDMGEHDWHQAMSDVEACAKVYLSLTSKPAL